MLNVATTGPDGSSCGDPAARHSWHQTRRSRLRIRSGQLALTTATATCLAGTSYILAEPLARSVRQAVRVPVSQACRDAWSSPQCSLRVPCKSQDGGRTKAMTCVCSGRCKVIFRACANSAKIEAAARGDPGAPGRSWAFRGADLSGQSMP